MPPRTLSQWRRLPGLWIRRLRMPVLEACLLVAAPVVGEQLAAQPLQDLERYEWSTFETADGLPISQVRDIEQGVDGYLYVATARGLVRFDGRAFVPVSHTGLRSEVMNDLFVDGSGRMWMLTGEGEIGVMEAGVVRMLPEPNWGEDGAPRVSENRSILAEFSETSDGDVWIDDDDGLLRVVPDEDLRMVRYAQDHGLPGDSVIAFSEVDGAEWIVTTRHRLFRAEGRPAQGAGSGGLRFAPFGPPLDARAGVRHDARGVWIGLTDDSVLRYARGSFQRFGEGATPLHLDSLGWRPGAAPLPWIRMPIPGRDSVSDDEHLRFVTSFATRDGERFAQAVEITPGDSRSRLFRLHGGQLREVGFREHLAARSIQTMHEDHEGSIWLGTSHGLAQMVPLRVGVLPAGDPLAGAFTLAVLQTRDGALWVGTAGAGLTRFGSDGSVQRLTHEDGLPIDQVRSLFEDRRGTLWIGTPRGFVARDTLGRWQARGATTEGIWGFAEDSDGRFWIAAGSQLLLDDGEGEGLRRVHDGGWEDTLIRVLHADHRRGLWVGTEAGLFLVGPDGARRFGQAHGLRDDFIASIHEEEDGTLWIGTYEHGLHRYRDGRFVPVTTTEGLHHDGIWQVVPDADGGYWMSSDAGVAWIERAELHRVADAVTRGETPIEPLVPIVFGTADGMRNVEMNRASPAGVRLSDGRIVFNGIEGIHVIDPARALRPPAPSATVVDAVTADGVVLAGRGTHRTAPAPRHVSFEFRALTFADVDRAEYRYRLDGYDEEWVYDGTRRYASYTNLAPGSYSLRVESRVPRGEWGGAATSATLSIPPRFWQRAWFLPAMLASMAAVLAFAHRARVRRLLGVERMRLQIAADLHDQVGSSLSSIVLLSEMLGESATQGATRARQLRRIGEAAAETASALRDVIWVVDPENDRLSSLVDRMRKTAEEMLPGIPVSFHASLDTETSLSPEFQRHAFLIFKEALHNAAKHARAADVDVDIDARGGWLRFSVRDGGVGFDPSVPSQGYGLGTMRRRAEKIGGELRIASTAAGTRVDLSAPLA